MKRNEKNFPDRWVVLEAKGDEIGTIYKILSGWVGGYLGSDSWKLSSSVVNVFEDKDNYIFNNTSGSTYVCNKSREGFTRLTNDIFNRIVDASDNECRVSKVSVEKLQELINEEK